MNRDTFPFLYIENTLACNLNCVMCSNPIEHRRTPLTSTEILAAISDLTPCVDRFVFSGGEPILDPAFHEYLAAIPSDRHVTLLTNGTLSSTPRFRDAICRVSEVRVSIDDMPSDVSSTHRLGSSPKKVFDDLLSIREANDDVVIVVTTILNRRLVENLEAYFDAVLTHPAEVDVLRMIPQVYYKGRTPQCVRGGAVVSPGFRETVTAAVPVIRRFVVEGLLARMDLDIQHIFNSRVLEDSYIIEGFDRHQRCCEYQKGLFINNDGDVILCPNCPTPIASVRDGGARAAARKRLELASSAVHDVLALTPAGKSVCPSCRFLRLCGGGCPAMTYNLTNDLTAPDPIKCSFSVLWEEMILPLLPAHLRRQFMDLVVPGGQHPTYYANLSEVLCVHHPKAHLEEPLHRKS